MAVTDLTIEDTDTPPAATVTFDDQTVQQEATAVTIVSATFEGTESFNVVVHEATDSDFDGDIEAADGEIDTKIGESAELDAGTNTDITVDISKQVADIDDVSQLTANQTLIAMLHTTNSSAVDDIVHTAPITRDRTPVFDEGDIRVNRTLSSESSDLT